MEFEFQESEVIFKDAGASHDYRGYQEAVVPFRRNSRSNGLRKKAERSSSSGNSSPPVDIPENIPRFRDFEEYMDDDEEEKVPPHVIVDRRRMDGKVACSVCFGHGRTLKGRYLSEVRNSVLRLTGFLEPLD